MFPLVIPILEGVASYVGFEIGKKLFGNTKTKNLPIPIKSKRKIKQKTSLPLAPKKMKSNLPIKSKKKRNSDVVDVEIIPDKPKKTLLDVLDNSNKTNSIMQSSTIATLARTAIAFETISSSLNVISETMEVFREELEFRKNPVEIKDLEGNTITKMSPREIELTQRATRAKLDNDENNLDINDVIDDYDDTFNLLEKVEELFKFQGITKDITDMKG